LEKKGFKSVDVEMVKFLTEKLSEFPLVVANKTDKTNIKELEANLNEFINRISDGSPSEVENSVFTTSLKTGKGVGALKNAIHTRLLAKGYKTQFKTQT
jgi:GTP-binding protein EngB required for normal cell division